MLGPGDAEEVRSAPAREDEEVPGEGLVVQRDGSCLGVEAVTSAIFTSTFFCLRNSLGCRWPRPTGPVARSRPGRAMA